MMPTIRDRLRAALLARGYTETPGRTTRYVTMTKPGAPTLFLGKAGALRAGPNVTLSVPQERLRLELLKEAQDG